MDRGPLGVCFPGCFGKGSLEAGGGHGAGRGSGQDEDTPGPGGALGVKKWQPTPACLLSELHRPRSLPGCSPWGLNVSGTTERLTPGGGEGKEFTFLLEQLTVGDSS